MASIKEKMSQGVSALNNSDTPWYVKAAYQLGVPAIIAGFLIWALVHRVDAEITSVKENLALHAVDSAHSVKKLEKIEIILRQICVNGADSAQDRNNCFQ